jgi:hypothetical protein
MGANIRKKGDQAEWTIVLKSQAPQVAECKDFSAPGFGNFQTIGRIPARRLLLHLSNNLCNQFL